MEIDPIHKLFDNLVTDITPIAFEKLCFDVISVYAEKERLTEFHITHNEKTTANDGTYQIDVYAEFTALSVKYKTIIECKRQSNPLKREVVAVLADKVRNLGVQKGIIMSTCGFQKGAIQYASQHGIALYRLLMSTSNIFKIPSQCQMYNYKCFRMNIEGDFLGIVLWNGILNLTSQASKFTRQIT